MTKLHRISFEQKSKARVDVIFVHGLGGDAFDSWQAKGEPKTFWPKWVDRDLPEAVVYSVGFDADPSGWFGGSAMPIVDRAVNILALLDAEGIGTRPVFFIAHSLGGLVVKQMLRAAEGYGEPSWKKLLEQTRGIVFLATPHSGSKLASYVSMLGQLFRLTKVVGELEASEASLRDLNLWYRNSAERLRIKNRVFFETRPTSGIQVVDETSADPGIRDVIPCPIDSDHIGICKPHDATDLLYRSVIKFIADGAADHRRLIRSPTIDDSCENGEPHRSDLFDVALSFSGRDRPIARQLAEALRQKNIAVFYDEWFKSHMWGQDLVLLLRDVYLKSRFCVPLISQSYIHAAYPQHEFSTILERQLHHGSAFLLPVRLDESEFPAGLRSTIAYVDYAKEGSERIASMIADRLRSQAGAVDRGLMRGDLLVPKPPITESKATRSLETHRRQFPKSQFAITTNDILKRLDDPSLQSSPAFRARLADDFIIYLNWKHRANLGIGYAVWRDGESTYLSTLPSFSAAQKTLEFKLERDTLLLVNEWEAVDKRLAKLEVKEWQPAVKGLVADRPTHNLDREVVLLILLKKDAPLAFPTIPRGAPPEKLCDWIEQNPPNDYLDWGRDPRLVPGQIGLWLTVFHRPTGVGFLSFTLQGRWSSPAFLAFQEALRVGLPTRYLLRVVGQGAIRVGIFLGSLRKFDVSASKAVDITYAAIARMSAASREFPVDPPLEDFALPELSTSDTELFAEAFDIIGDREYIELVDAADLGFSSADWIKLRHSPMGSKVFLYDPPSFDWGNVVTHSECRAYIRSLERSAGPDLP